MQTRPSEEVDRPRPSPGQAAVRAAGLTRESPLAAGRLAACEPPAPMGRAGFAPASKLPAAEEVWGLYWLALLRKSWMLLKSVSSSSLS